MGGTPIEKFFAKWGITIAGGLLIAMLCGAADKVYTTVMQTSITQTKLDNVEVLLTKLEEGQTNLYRTLSEWRSATDQRLTALEQHNTDQQQNNTEQHFNNAAQKQNNTDQQQNSAAANLK